MNRTESVIFPMPIIIAMKIFDFLRKTLKIVKVTSGSEPPFCSVIVPAAGQSRRMGTNKMFTPLNGIPVLARTLMALEACESVNEIIVAARSEDIAAVAEFKRVYGIEKLAKIVAGGSERTDSVRKAMSECSEKAELIAVHDGARPLATPELIERCINEGRRTNAALAAVKMKDTVKRVRDGVVTETVDRSELYLAQTPQVFSAKLLRAAYKKAEDDGKIYTDDCAPVEALGKHVFICEGDYTNIKITTPEDVIVAESILEARDAGL